MDTYKYIALNGKRYKIDEYEKWCYALSSDEEDEKLRQFFKEWTDERDFVIGKTSGSTGAPKSIRLSKKAMLASAELTNSFFNLKAGDSILLCLSVNYIAGKMVLVRAIAGGLNVVIAKPSSEP
ncbi:MAG: AMP-binding protein, partial [Paludibacteraceae bacterium]|nr:AMP-binding protein [Paludibacteraceae bacterium]